MGNVFVCYAGCSSSSGKESFGEFAFCQKSATTNDKTIVRRDKEVDHRSNRSSRCIEDWHTQLWQRTTFVVTHFSRAPVCVCETQMALWGLVGGVWLHNYTVDRHSTGIHTLPFGPSTQLDFFCPSRALPAVRWLGYHRQPTCCSLVPMTLHWGSHQCRR